MGSDIAALAEGERRAARGRRAQDHGDHLAPRPEGARGSSAARRIREGREVTVGAADERLGYR